MIFASSEQTNQSNTNDHALPLYTKKSLLKTKRGVDRPSFFYVVGRPAPSLPRMCTERVLRQEKKPYNVCAGRLLA